MVSGHSRLKVSVCLFLLLSMMLAACQNISAGAWAESEAAAGLSTQAAAATTAVSAAVPATSRPVETIQPTPSPTAGPHRLGVPEYLPERLRNSIQLPAGWAGSAPAAENDLLLDVFDGTTPDQSAVPWVYALAAPFPTLEDDLSAEALVNLWVNGPTENAQAQSLFVDPSTRAVFEKLWGPASSAVKTQPEERLVETTWDNPNTWAIVPFEKLEPRWKVIAVDGQSPVSKEFKPEGYPLTVYFTLHGDEALRHNLLANGPLAQTNRKPERLTTVVVTGVTALVRGTASFMEGRGLTYPAQDIGPWLREADILHVSNEVAFAENCPPPFDWKDLVFCSRPKYIELLEDVGTDVIELTGDHFSDWGPEAALYTVEMYKEHGMPYYGGGANSEEARQAVRFEHNGNRIAFIGCNAKPEGYALASETTPGALHCDMDRLAEDVHKLRAEDYLPIVTFQHLEYYSYEANPLLQVDFRRMAESGAAIVSGSQAHQPHAFEFQQDSFLHYGLGNLFFDQTNQGDAPRTAFIDRHVFYGGRHISTELLTIYLVDYARSRPMTVEERQEMLRKVFEASGW